MGYPTLLDERRAARADLRSRGLRRAARGWIPRSIKCEQGYHARGPNGCKNDGTGCLCGCHDQEATV